MKNNLETIKAMEDSNLKWILWAWAMGYSASIKLSNGEAVQIIGKINDGLLIMSNALCLMLEETLKWEFKIIGYKYGAELCGNEPIPEKTQFKIRKTEQIGEYVNQSASRICLKLESLGNIWYDRSEVEPIFT